MQRFAVIVAGGRGVRLGAGTPKQFLNLLGKPIVVHTIEAFLASDDQTKIILVLPSDHFETWERIKGEHLPKSQITIVAGGETRFQSVKNGLCSIAAEEGLVAIHDAVRPCIDPALINQSFEGAEDKGSAVLAVPIKDSIREVKGGFSKAVDRSTLVSVQTPQTFRLSLVREAFDQPESPVFTDDATVFESAGHQVNLIMGSYDNLKVTTEDDLYVCGLLMKRKEPTAGGPLY